MTAVLILMVASCLTLGCLAFDNTGNTEIRDNIQSVADRYFNKEEGKTPAEENTYKAVMEYWGKIDELRMETDHDTTAEMELEFERGKAVGSLSWIYYSHIGEIEALSLSDAEAIYEVYSAQKGVIDSAELEFFTENGVTVCYTKLLDEIYSRKIELLRKKDNGNGLVSKRVDEALTMVQSKCSYLPSYGEDAGNCKSFYAEVVKRVELQTLRDITIEELKAVTGKIYPDKAFDISEDGEYRSFFEQINSRSVESAYVAGTYTDGQAIADFNRALETAVNSMIADSSELGAYMRSYYSDLRAAVSGRVAEASLSGSERHAELSDLFDGFSLGITVAAAKDELTAYINGDAFSGVEKAPLESIAAEYTGSGAEVGIFDRAENEQAVANELFRAKARCYWYSLCEDALGEIVGYVGEDHKIADDAKALYARVDSGLAAGEYPDGGAADELLAADKAGLETLIAKAEATEFYGNNKEIIDKVISENAQITAADKPALIKAIGESDFSHPETEGIVAKALEALGESYKALTVSEILALVTRDGAESLRATAADELCELVEALEPKNGDGAYDLTALMEGSDEYLEKAKIVKELFDGYVSDYLEGGDEYFGERAEDTVKQGAEEIITAVGGDEAQKKAETLTDLKRLAALEDIYTSAKGYETLSGVPEILSAALTEIEAHSTDTAIDGYAAEKIAAISELIRQSEANDALNGIQNEVNGIKRGIEGFEYASSEEKQELLSELEKIKNKADNAIRTAPDGPAVKAALEAALAELSDFEDRAENCELDACLADAIAALNGAYGKREDYSAENYVIILELIDEYEDELATVRGLDEYISIRDRGIAEIVAVEDLLETAKRVGAERLAAAYAELMEKKHCYSAEGLVDLEEIYSHSIAELNGFTEVPADAERVYAFVDDRIALMRGVRLEKIYTADGLLATDNEKVYPDGYSVSDNGYIGAVWSEDGIPSDTKLLIEMVGTDGIADLIRKAAKNGQVLVGNTSAAKSIIKLLRRAEVLLGVKIELGDILPDGGRYRVSVLLPENTDSSDILGVVFIRADGGIEFFEVTPDAELLEFETAHFSEYYVLSRGAVDLYPLIICLSIIILCELCIVALLMLRRRKRRLSELCGIVPVPLLLATVYRPAGGNIIAALLGLTAVALAGVIGYLVYLEIRSAKRKAVPAPEKAEELAPEAVTVTSEAEAAVAELLPAEETQAEYKDVVSVEEAEELMSDSEATHLIEENTAGYIDNEIYRGDKKAEININTISECFEDGDTVTLNSLKEKKLVPKNAGQVKILARGILDKRLCVVAQDFSRAAVKMIQLTGGEAIYTHSSEERGGKSL